MLLLLGVKLNERTNCEKASRNIVIIVACLLELRIPHLVDEFEVPAILSLHFGLTILLPLLLARRSIFIYVIYVSLLAILVIQIRLDFTDDDGSIFAIGCMVVLTSALFTLILKTAHHFVEDASRKMLSLESQNAELLDLF